MHRTVATMISLSLGLVLFACGGGGSDSPAPYDGPLTIPWGGGENSPPTDDGSGDPSPGPAINWRVLAQGSQSFPTSLTTPVARNDTDYVTIYLLYYTPMPPGVGAPDVGPPAVDFAGEMVVAVFLGGRPTGGYSVDISRILPVGNGLEVHYKETRPGPGEVVTQALTQPFVMAAVTRVDGPVTFIAD